MKPFTLLLLTLLPVFKLARAADYEVTIDGKTFMFTKQVAQEVVLKDGKRISISVAEVTTKKYNKNGISFSYPSEMALNEEAFNNVIKQVTLTAADSTRLIIQIYPNEVNPAEVRSELLAAFREEFSRLGAVDTATCKITIGGIEREGTEVRVTLTELEHKCQVFSFSKDDKIVAMVFQYDKEDIESATRRFGVVTDSIK